MPGPRGVVTDLQYFGSQRSVCGHRQTVVFPPKPSVLNEARSGDVRGVSVPRVRRVRLPHAVQESFAELFFTERALMLLVQRLVFMRLSIGNAVVAGVDMRVLICNSVLNGWLCMV
jgi:hypothetical protein